MSAGVDLYNTSYEKFASDAQAAVRLQTYGEDIGQTSWMTADELRHFIKVLNVDRSSRVLEVGSGSGGPALFLANETGCALMGVDANEFGVRNANELARKRGVHDRAEFKLIDASRPLPFEDGSFDVVFSNDVLCHLPDRQRVLREWHRVLRPNGQILFTDALVVTGIVSHKEIATRSAIGVYFYLPVGENERLIQTSGFELVAVQDLSSAAADISKRWHDARREHRDAMIPIEGEDNFNGLQEFLWCVHTVTSERRLSRFMYQARKI